MQSFRQLLYNRYTDFTAKNTFTSEATILSGASQPVLWHPALDFTQVGRQFRLSGRGVLNSTGAPSFTFIVRMGSLAANGGTNITGVIIGQTAAMPTISGATNNVFDFALNIMLTSTVGIGSGNTTITSSGLFVSSGITLQSNDMVPTPGSATWTTTCDNSVDNYINISAVCTASSGSNGIQLKHLELEAVN
jgi:hypothetical protein